MEKTGSSFGDGGRLGDPYVVTVKGKIVIADIVIVIGVIFVLVLFLFLVRVGVGTRA